MKRPSDIPQHKAVRTAPEEGASGGAGEVGLVIFGIGSLDERE
jgi:hypothetical protein